MKMFPMKFYAQRAKILGIMLGFCMIIYIVFHFVVDTNV